MSSETAASIAAVESGLLPAVLLDGVRDRMALADRMAHHRVPGLSVAVLEDGEIAWARGYGLADAATGRRIDQATCFQAASISKFVTTVAALRLVERGQGAAVMVNSDNGWLLRYEVVRAVADAYGWPEYLVTKTVAAIDPALYDGYVGEYRWEQGVVRIMRGPDGLEWETPELGSAKLFPSSTTEFFAVDRPAEIELLLDADGRATGLILRYGRLERRAARSSA